MSMDDMGTEYVYPPEKWVQAGIICAAEEQFATHAELDAAVSDVCDVQDELEARIKDLEALHADLYTHVHSRPHWLTPPNVTEWLAQHNPPFAAAAHVPEGDYAHIPAAKWKFICDELETLRAKWDAVPWKDIATVLRDAADSFAWDGVDEWYVANAPEEAKE